MNGPKSRSVSNPALGSPQAQQIWEFLSHAPSAGGDQGPEAGNWFSRRHDFDNTVNALTAAPFPPFARSNTFRPEALPTQEISEWHEGRCYRSGFLAQ